MDSPDESEYLPPADYDEQLEAGYQLKYGRAHVADQGVRPQMGAGSPSSNETVQ